MMTSVSATFNGSNVNVVNVVADGCSYLVTYVDQSGNLKISRGFIDNTTGTATIGTSAKVN